MWRLADGKLEFSREMCRASTSDRTKIPNVNDAVQIVVDVGSYAKDLPSSQTTSREAITTRTTLDFCLQDVQCCNQRRPCHLPVTLQLSLRCFKQLGETVRNQVKLLISCKGRFWCGSKKCFHSHSLDELSESARECSMSLVLARLFAVCKGNDV